MKSVSEILRGKPRKLLSIGPEASVYEALVTMAEHEVGALVVMEGAHLAGIFSERDYARKVILHGKASRETAVRDIMTTRVLCVQPGTTLEECMGLMTDKRVRHLPVLEEGRVTAVISIGDVVKEMISEQRALIEQLEQYIHG